MHEENMMTSVGFFSVIILCFVFASINMIIKDRWYYFVDV